MRLRTKVEKENTSLWPTRPSQAIQGAKSRRVVRRSKLDAQYWSAGAVVHPTLTPQPMFTTRNEKTTTTFVDRHPTSMPPLGSKSL